jgi:hypothetical protein
MFDPTNKVYYSQVYWSIGKSYRTGRLGYKTFHSIMPRLKAC